MIIQSMNQAWRLGINKKGIKKPCAKVGVREIHNHLSVNFNPSIIIEAILIQRIISS